MTAALTMATVGRAGEHTSTALSGVISPSEFATKCREIAQQHDGHAAHRALDELVTNLLSKLGYGEGMAIFIAHVSPYHGGDACRERKGR